jgi:hypothetical protein
VLYTELVLFWSTLVDLIWDFTFKLNYFEQSEIPFFLFIDIDVAYLYLLGRVFLFDKIFDYFNKVYFLFEFAVFKLFAVEYED